MLHCPKCDSTDLKVLAIKVRDVPTGKTRKRACKACNHEFISLEAVFELPKPKAKPKAKPKSKKATKGRPRKRVLRPYQPRRPSLDEIDMDAMTDDELEAFLFSE